MSAIGQAPVIRLRHTRITRRMATVIAAVAAWVAAVIAVIGHWPMQLVPTGIVGVSAFILAPPVVLWVGAASIAGYHRARGSFPDTVWHFSSVEWAVGREFSLDPQHCKFTGRMIRSLHVPRRATFVFDHRPSRSDVAANAAGRGSLYELQVITAPSAHYRRWDGTGAVGSLEPIRVRVLKVEDTNAIR